MEDTRVRWCDVNNFRMRTRVVGASDGDPLGGIGLDACGRMVVADGVNSPVTRPS